MSTETTPPKQQERLQKWFSEKHSNFSCPICQKKKFSTGMMTYSSYVDGATITQSPGPAMIQIICEDCYNVTLFAFDSQF